MDQGGSRETMEKFDIKLKSKPKDGVILQLHHTVKGPQGKCRRIRFSSGIFDDSREKLACADNVGNLFVLDFCDLKFWKLASAGPCSALHFIPYSSDILIVADAKKFNINFVNIETGYVLPQILSGHTAPVKYISFSNHKNNLLTASPIEAILWECRNYTKYFTLNTYLGAQIQQIMFSPAGDYLVACFQNDTVQIWKHESMKSIKQIIPGDLKHLKNITFTMNGRAMVISGLAPTMIVFSMDTWKALKSIDLSKYGIAGAQQTAFIPQPFDGGANKILAILSSDCVLHIFDLEAQTVVHSIKPETSGIRRFVVSPTGKYFFCILQQGEVNIYNSSFVLEQASLPTIYDDQKNSVECHLAHTAHEYNHIPCREEVEQKMRTCMDSARLRRILMQYGEYPDKFRLVIWRSLLDTPNNKTAYSALIDKGMHAAYKDIEKHFTIHSSVTLKNLKRLLSCLAHWCPLFGVLKFLPGFVFPFVKVLQKDPLLMFECVATILINHCQLWFEYAPFPPISILAMIENILAEHDQQLLDHFCEVGVTSQIYALKLLETAFSEVLTCSEWLILWDHVLSNEPAFLLMAVVSYNVVQRNALRKLNKLEHVQNFFHKQNPIDKKTFLKKAYLMLNETSEDIHPRKFINGFTSLKKGDVYQQFTGYPKATICLKLAKKEKKKKGHKESLKDLTTKTQLKEIYNRAKEGEETDYETIQSDNSVVSFVDVDNRGDNNKYTKHSNQFVDQDTKKVKEELIESVYYPPGDQNVKKDKARRKHSKYDKEAIKHSSRSKNSSQPKKAN